MGEFNGKLQWDSPMGESSGRVQWESSMGNSNGIVQWGSSVGESNERAQRVGGLNGGVQLESPDSSMGIRPNTHSA
jgi:hypothetical protein